MLAPLRKLLIQSKRFPVALLLAGLVGGIPIGWFLGSRSTVGKVSILSAKATAYSTLSNEELKNRSLLLVSAIRDLARSYYDEDNRMRIADDKISGKTISRVEADRIWQAWIAASAKLHDSFMDRYKTNFWADALLLREVIVAKVGGAPGSQNSMLFQHPTNILGVEQGANSLELLGKSLPEK